MHLAVQDAFISFTRELEGAVPFMYVDILGLVTTGFGDLIDSVPSALELQWRVRADGTVATPDAVASEWHAVKDGHINAFQGPRPLYITDDAMNALALNRLLKNETYLSRRWSNWAAWPADAQLGAHSCAWAAGAAWRAPKFDAAVANMDFETCAGPAGDSNFAQYRGEAWLQDSFNPGLHRRNLRNKILFTNAAQVIRFGHPPDTLYWPNQL